MHTLGAVHIINTMQLRFHNPTGALKLIFISSGDDIYNSEEMAQRVDIFCVDFILVRKIERKCSYSSVCLRAP